MKTVRIPQDDDCYWYPYRPSLRLPLAIFGALWVFMFLNQTMVEHHWNWGTFGLLILFAKACLTKPHRRRKTFSYYLFVGLVVIGMALFFLVSAYYRDQTKSRVVFSGCHGQIPHANPGPRAFTCQMGKRSLSFGLAKCPSLHP